MKNTNQTILALKYRPQTFDELIGQEISSQTIKNSIKYNKIPNAYLLTGIRGIGKTTTARIIAKSLNCKNGIENLCRNDMCEHCMGVINSNHIDVIEMDAASKTGIDDIRELIESSKYYPSIAKYKVYIIDEVHMLSKQAFNGLLKTLEEPPPHLKFIFATTELKKIPVTIISRCQRYDLNRVNNDLLFQKLKKISEIEKIKISDDALKLIAKVSEGSVRDSLSLLDRALIGQYFSKKEIDKSFVQQMLGLADHTKAIELLKFIISGNQELALTSVRKIIENGAQPKSLLNDLLEIIYHVINFKNFGKMNLDMSMSETELNLIDEIAKEVEKSILFIFWQFILKSLDEIAIVSNQIISLEMIILRLMHIKSLPSYEKILNSISSSYEIGSNKKDETTFNQTANEIIDNTEEKKKTPTSQLKNVTQKIQEIKPINKIDNFKDLLLLASQKKEIELKYELEKNVNLVSFLQGKIIISFNENLGKNFIRNLTEKLLEWTGKRWVISFTKEKGEKTIFEKKRDNKKNILIEEKNNKIYKKFKENFPDADLKEVNFED